MRVLVVLLFAAAVSLEAAEQDFWSDSSVDVQDLPGNEVVLPAGEPLDRIQVISSAIRVLPRPLRTRTRRSQQEHPATTDKQPSNKNIHKKKQSEHGKVSKRQKNVPAHSLSRAHAARSLKMPTHHDEERQKGKRQKNVPGHSLPRTLKMPTHHGVEVHKEKHQKNIPAHSMPRAHAARSLKIPTHREQEDHKIKHQKNVPEHSLPIVFELPTHHAVEEHKGKRHNKKAVSNEGSSKRHGAVSRRFKREAITSFRRPRDFQFVTNRLDRAPPPSIVRVYSPGTRDEREIDWDRGHRKAQRRIIYYATLPEIVRPPSRWYPSNDYYYDSSRQPSTNMYYSPSKSSYPSYSAASENDITRVQSNIIDVTNPRHPSYSSPPKFTIIDVDPPYYNRPYDTPSRFYDVRTPPYRDYSHFPSQHFHSEPPLEQVKLQTPPPDYSSSSSNSTESTTNSTRFLPDMLPVNLRSLAKFVT